MIGAVPDRQSIVIAIVGEPAIEILFELVVILAAGPLIIVAAHPGAHHGQLRQKRFEVLAVALLDQAAVDVAVWLLAVEEQLEIRKAIGVDAKIGEIDILEI